MKNFLFYFFIVCSACANAQPGVLYIDNLEDPWPVAQTFVVLHGQPDMLYFCAEESVSVAYLNELLSPYSVSLEDGEVEPDGDRLFYLDNGNGYSSTVLYYTIDGEGVIMIKTYFIDDEE